MRTFVDIPIPDFNKLHNFGTSPGKLCSFTLTIHCNKKQNKFKRQNVYVQIAHV